MPSAIILGGTGAIGHAASQRLRANGWDVTLTSHTSPSSNKEHFISIIANRHDPHQLRRVLSGGADLLIDYLCYQADDAVMLLPYLSDITKTIMISSKAVDVDQRGRHSNSDKPADCAGPIDETCATLRPNGLEPNTREGYGANKIAAEETLLDSGASVAILRPSKIHGAHARRPRKWVFVRRAIEQRLTLLYDPNRAGIDHPSAASNIAALITALAHLSGNQIVNIADPDAPSGIEIASIVGELLGVTFVEQPVTAPSRRLHPWDTTYPLVLDTKRAHELGYQPIGDYASTIKAEVDWLMANTTRQTMPLFEDDPFFAPFFAGQAAVAPPKR
ncbi:NAD(P)-dependent oxidoreductase [Ferrimicrobium sp.]|uniref:NAD-dependent epimerase/dehydratase family protein n=1 Tax=Ferrimicrobium sp. TaxID=2926050 RepID=UPI00263150A1|nr:NAD-dependent epimerase/dehydratase family protein [Ferrimicrobium sp.]